MKTAALLLTALTALTACSRRDAGPAATAITLGAYTTPREAYAELLPAFAAERRAAGAPVELRESYLGSGAQARAIIGGFDADLAALSLEPDIEAIRAAGLITHDWKANPYGGMVTRSVVVIGVRPGNPKGIRDWADLARPGVEVLTPNVRTSGGAMWNVLAIHGAALRSGDRAASVALLAGVLANVRIMDRGARDSMLTFERGVGDAIITYENELLVGRAKGQRYDYVVPRSTILIENPVALVDAAVDRHRNRAAVEALREFLWTPAAQRRYAAHGLRPVVQSVAAEVQGRFAPVDDLFTIRDLGGWEAATREVFAPGAIYDAALARSREPAR
ncbi:MAG: sulfate ABC transporter substrate-binding protein [Myxococcales bacterium]|nr:sulfate ABC transporter substrate-binding protein [Myxococcales bacterium]MCB9552388.1 sulfate ABC transporter substrate-binding protein [Myxococcales bacterium]